MTSPRVGQETPGKRALIVVVGSTSSGKSALAVQIARRYGGEVISADSRQVYRGLDIGSGKIVRKEMRSVPHHLLDVASPCRTYTAAQYQKQALQIINGIIRRGKLPILCGGTGFYIQAVVDGVVFPNVKPDNKLRCSLQKLNTEKLFLMLQKKDPARAGAVDPGNKARLIRSLEIIAVRGRVPPIQKKPFPANMLLLGISISKTQLRARIERRIRVWLRRGLLREVQLLRAQGISRERVKNFGLVYEWALHLLEKEISRETFIEGLSRDIRRYAKRQMTWFHGDKRIRWIRNQEMGLRLVQKFLKNGS